MRRAVSVPAGPAGSERFVDVALPLPLDRSFSYRLPPELPTPAPGTRVRVPFGAGEETGFVLGSLLSSQLAPGLRADPAKIKAILEVLDAEPWLDAGLLSLARWLADYYAASPGEVLRSMLPIKPMKRPRAPAPAPLPPPDAPQRLTPPQAAALATVVAALDAGGFHRFLLDGVTGSGKTEVYLQAIAHCLAQGRQAIVLVPEISLTPQAAQRFRARLGEGVGVFHSGLSAGERYAVWAGLRAGALSVVLGPRSAIFAPCPRLGLVVIDEEHDSSYKQTEKPRYHARSVAMLRAQGAGAVVLLGSATPALESLHNVHQGKYRRLELPERVTGRPRPTIEILPMAAETGLLAAPLAEAIADCVGRGEKAILLLNRRGHSRLRLCRDCGHLRRCGRCEIPLVYHSRRERLICHYCGGRRWVLLGAGTQQLELELGLRFPGLPLHRMDLDSTRRRGSHADILARFAAPGPAILMGTQMIAKGHHFPEVTLVGVVDADLGLFLPDFRAAERSWQLLEQVAGRSGRGERPGRVLVQTYAPEHPLLVALAAGELATLVERELAERRALGYPPFQRLLSLLISAPEEELATQAAQRLATALCERWPGALTEPPGSRRTGATSRGSGGAARTQVEILGPVEGYPARIKERYRQQLLVKGRLDSDQKRAIVPLFADIAKRLGRSGALTLDLDVDPESLL
jgi:primosomal protein N' (replication factor Y)